METKFSSENLKEIAESIINYTDTLENVCKKYNCDSRTLKFELLTYLQQEGNEELLLNWLKTEPYKSKESDLDYIAVIKYIIKNDVLIKEIREELGVPERTYTRNIAKLRNNESIDEETGISYKELMEIYDRKKKNQLKYFDYDILDKIDTRSGLELYTKEHQKIKKLEQMLSEFQKHIIDGITEEEAVKLMQEKYPDISLSKIHRYGKEYSGMSTQVYYNTNKEICSENIKYKEEEK